MSKHPDTKPIDWQYEAALLSEESGEVCQIVGKTLRFGWDSCNPTDPERRTNLDLLHDECGDQEAAIAFSVERGLLDRSKLDARKAKRLARLREEAPEPMVATQHALLTVTGAGSGLTAAQERAAAAVLAVLMVIALVTVWWLSTYTAKQDMKLAVSEAALECFKTDATNPMCETLKGLAQ